MRDAALSIAVPIEPVQPELDGIAALVEQALGGDMAAFEALMRRHERLVMMTALRLLKGNPADAEDAAQTVFLRMHRYLGRFRRGGDLSYWLYRITINVCHDFHHRAQRRAEVAIDPRADIQQPTPGADAELEDALRRRMLAAGLDELPEKERAAIVLRDVEGLATGEVAKILGSSAATVRSQISSARRKIRKFVEKYNEKYKRKRS